MAISSVGTDNTSFFNSMLGSTSSTSSSGGMLGDYALIKSGSYKKLLNAYYAKTSGTEKDSETAETEKKNLVSAKGSADTLKTQAEALKNLDLTEENREKITETVKSFVSAYNAMIDSGSEVDDTSVLRNTLWMTQITSSNSGLLSDIGITIDKDNKLVVDEEKLSSARLTTVSSLFKGASSFMDKISQKAAKISSTSAEAALSGKRAAGYTNSGDFESLSTSALYDAIV